MISSSLSPSVVWLEIWKMLPLASEPSPNRPRTTMPSWLTARTTLSIWPGDDQRGQVHHRRAAHAGAEIGRAGGEVAELGREGVVEVLLEGGVELVDRGPDFLELEAGAQDLDAEVVLLVDHDDAGLILADDQARAGLGMAELAADEVALHQDLLLQFVQTRSTGRARPRFICGRAATACMHWSRISRFCASLAQPGKGCPARLRASRMRVISTTALLPAAVSVNSDGAAMSVNFHGLSCAAGWPPTWTWLISSR
jgi:hypothetical protein